MHVRNLVFIFEVRVNLGLLRPSRWSRLVLRGDSESVGGACGVLLLRELKLPQAQCHFTQITLAFILGGISIALSAT